MNAISLNPVGDLENALCANERQGVLLETIDDKLESILHEMQPGEARDREIHNVWLLLWTARENHECLQNKMSAACQGLLDAKRRGRAA